MVNSHTDDCGVGTSPARGHQCDCSLLIDVRRRPRMSDNNVDAVGFRLRDEQAPLSRGASVASRRRFYRRWRRREGSGKALGFADDVLRRRRRETGDVRSALLQRILTARGTIRCVKVWITFRVRSGKLRLYCYVNLG